MKYYKYQFEPLQPGLGTAWCEVDEINDMWLREVSVEGDTIQFGYWDGDNYVGIISEGRPSRCRFTTTDEITEDEFQHVWRRATASSPDGK